MANPLFIPIRFAANGAKNVIQKILQVGQDQESATWNLGWPAITMIPKEDGGLAPKGQDFNGVLYTLSDHAVHRQNGEQILFSQDVVDNYGGYSLGSIIQSNDSLRHYRSLINNNTFDPNTTPIAGRWEIYAGSGSLPTASSSIAGIIKVINTLTSNDTGSALSAAQGKVIKDVLDRFQYNTSRIIIPVGNRNYIIQWGETGFIGGLNTTHTSAFTYTFPTACLHVSLGTKTNTTTGAGSQRMVQLVSSTNSGFTWFSDAFESAGSNISATYLAIGY